jgi:hypothetical protein
MFIINSVDQCTYLITSWDETSQISPRAKKVVDAFKRYADTMNKAGYPYR